MKQSAIRRALTAAAAIIANGVLAAWGTTYVRAATPTSLTVCLEGPEEERQSCAHSVLRALDGRLNALYRELQAELDEAVRLGLRETQRSWLRIRDANCGLMPELTQRKDWLAVLAASPRVAACVAEATEARIAELEKMRRQAGGHWVEAEVQPSTAAPREPASGVPGAHRLASRLAQRTGRHYFELTIDETRLDGQTVTLSLGAESGKHVPALSLEARPRDLVIKLGGSDSIRIVGGDLGDLRVPKKLIGVAIDLDTGRLHVHRDGQWENNSPPGRGGGVPLPGASDVRGEIRADVPLGPLVERGALVANFGETPFSGFLPPGYRGMDWPAHLAVPSASGTKPTLRFPAAGERIAGATLTQWVARYAEWVHSFTAAERPSADTTGVRCGAGQAGPAWFLTGSSRPGRIVRRCAVPAGKTIVVPILNVSGKAPAGSDCGDLQLTVAKFTERNRSLRFALDGTAWPDVDKRKHVSGCLTVRDGGSGTMLAVVNAGYWVFVPPLTAGRHVIEFGGVSEVAGFEQDIRYELEVQ